MIEDKELCRLAAKAAGYPLWPEWDCAPTGIFLGQGSDGDLQVVWNPLEDDGDALRLAVKLGMPVYGREIGGSVDDIFVDEADCGNDPYAATRRAIVRAAAEIGKAITPS